jgi:hypothetical protein
VRLIWSSRIAEVSAKYGENAPMAAVCCNACRTCVTTNAIGLGVAGILSAAASVGRVVRGARINAGDVRRR